MAEWSIAAVLKTVELQGSGGSNPSLSAGIGSKKMRLRCKLHIYSVFYFMQAAGKCYSEHIICGLFGVPFRSPEKGTPN